MNPIKMLPLLLLISSITGCTGYGSGGTYANIPTSGYYDTRINSNTAMVTYDGSMFSNPSRIHNYLLYRCAQVTINNGYDYFIITSESTSPVNVNTTSKVSYNGYLSDRAKMYNNYDRNQTLHSANETSSPMRENKSTTQVAVIKMFQGKPPCCNRAYVATDILAHVGSATY